MQRSLEEERQKCEAEKKRLQQEVYDVRINCGDKKDEFVENLRLELDECRSTCDAEKQQLRLVNENLKEENFSFEETNRNLNAFIKDNEKTIYDLREQINDLENLKAQGEGDCSAYQNEINRLRGELNRLQGELAAIQACVDEAKQEAEDITRLMRQVQADWSWETAQDGDLKKYFEAFVNRQAQVERRKPGATCKSSLDNVTNIYGHLSEENEARILEQCQREYPQEKEPDLDVVLPVEPQPLTRKKTYRPIDDVNAVDAKRMRQINYNKQVDQERTREQERRRERERLEEEKEKNRILKNDQTLEEARIRALRASDQSRDLKIDLEKMSDADVFQEPEPPAIPKRKLRYMGRPQRDPQCYSNYPLSCGDDQTCYQLSDQYAENFCSVPPGKRFQLTQLQTDILNRPWVRTHPSKNA